MKQVRTIESKPTGDSFGADDPSSVSRTTEVLFGVPRSGEVSQTNDAVFPISSSLPPVSHEEFESRVRPPPPQPTQERGHASARRDEATPVKAKVRKLAPPIAGEAPPSPGEDKEDYLLVSKSWYIQEGAQNRKEAVRISKALKAFRWKIEPVYTIGVMLDDIVSIETSRNEISGELTKRMEDSGYTLSAVTADQGKLVAWFKKNASFELPSLPDAEDSFR